MNEKSLKDLRSLQSPLLLVEVAAWLHMLGKYYEGFQAGTQEGLKYATQLPDDLKETELGRLLTDPWIGKSLEALGIIEFQTEDISIHKIIQEHHNPKANTGFVRLLNDAHGRSSGVEKGALARFAPGQYQEVYLSTAIGFEDSAINLNEVTKHRKELYKYLETALQELKNSPVKEDWPVFRSDFITFIERNFRSVTAETRRPTADVTLFDQTFASVAFFKASLAQNILTGWKEPAAKNVPDKYHWRMLRVALDGPTFWEQAVGLNDVVSRKDLVKTALDNIQTLLEVEYPLGMEIYRDEYGSVFVIPDIENLLEMPTENGTPLQEAISRKTITDFGGEARFELSPPVERTRTMQLFGRIVQQPVTYPVPDVRLLDREWKRAFAIDTHRTQSQVCSVCGLRPFGPGQKGRNRGVCDTCETRRSERAKIWLYSPEQTIWMDEVADINGRVALVVGHFEISAWLSGEAFSTTMLIDPQKHRPFNKNIEIGFADILAECEKALQNPDSQFEGSSQLLNTLLPNYARGGFELNKEIYDLYVQDSDLKSTQPEAWRLALALMRLQPSPARIRRLWETTRLFGESVWKTLGAKNIIPQAGKRLAIRGELSSSGKDRYPGEYHALELKLSNAVKMNVVWDAEKKHFVSADNLARIEELLDQPVLEALRGEIVIEEPVGYGSANKLWGKIVIETATPLDGSQYIPIIPILSEPSTFMAIVPAQSALDVARAIKEKYEREVGKVRNRLPLQLGLVYADQHTPLRAIMDAGRRMRERALLLDGVWNVEASTAHEKETAPAPLQQSQFERWQEISLRNNDRSFAWRVPLMMGNGETLDAWYPYTYLAKAAPNDPAQNRQRWFIGPHPREADQSIELVHAADLKVGDSIYFTPATLEFQWLDSAARRFDIAYETNGQRRDLPHRPYLLDELDSLDEIWRVLEKHLSRSQIHLLRDLIEEKRQTWQPQNSENEQPGLFWQYCRDVLVNAEWRIKNELTINLDQWANYAARGWISDVIEIRLYIMKTKRSAQEEKHVE